ncbi:MAG: phosphotransferase [Acidobacteriales bacterium]|nr:phosphotransferase [Terriglobales bacterium]
MDVLEKLFKQRFQAPPDSVRPLQGELGGSERRLFRLSASQSSAIGVLHNVREENVAFVEFSRHFRRYGLPVPEIYAEDLDAGAYLEEDLGDTTLFQFLALNRHGKDPSPKALEAYRRVLALLPRFQVEAGRDLNYGLSYPRASFDRQSIAWDLNYFKYYFLRLAGIPFDEQALERDFGRLTRFLLTADREYFLYRDFQSRNIMLRDGQPFFLDYQGGRRGALQYDVASLLYDAKADLPARVREELLEYYLDRLSEFIDLDRVLFLRHYYGYVYVRIMQAMGAYGFRGFYERKPLFLQSVPYALNNLSWLLQNVTLPIKLPALMKAFQQMVTSEKLQGLASAAAPRPAVEVTPEAAELVVRVSSFSFHRGGPPADPSGNGGGFVFDSRAIPNPGREDQFKLLTGKDALVQGYLEKQPEVPEFLKHATAMVDAAVKNYQQRRFKHLTVSFGCTGGQHRSVYFAEQMAKHLRYCPGVQVVLRHVELEKMGQ